MQRSIPRNPALPKHFDKIEALVSDLVFLPRNEQPADVLFIFGARSSIDKIAKEAVLYLQSHLTTSRIVITGGSPQYNDLPAHTVSDSSEILASIRPEEFPDREFFIEEKSWDSEGNVEEAKKVFDFGTNCSSIAFIAMSHASKRQSLNLQTGIPGKKTYALPYDHFAGQPNVNQLNWMQNNFAAARVWGEVLRLDSYAGRGIFILTEEDAHTLHKIKMELKLHPMRPLTEQLQLG